MGKSLNDLLEEYYEKFGDVFPSMTMIGCTPLEDIIALVQKCIDEDTPYADDEDDFGVMY